MVKRIGVLGSGVVGTTLADGFLKHGYEVIRGSREPAKLAEWKARHGTHGSIGTFETAAAFSDLVVLAVKGEAAEKALQLCKPAHLFEKTVIDVTNPIADEPPVQGVVRFFTTPNESLFERLQRMIPRAHFVKAFSCVGHGMMVDPDFHGAAPSMFICGNSIRAKAEVGDILQKFGWEPEDLGGPEAARAIEPLCMLWCVYGWSRGRWDHAFKLIHSDRRAAVHQVPVRVGSETPTHVMSDGSFG
jgi:predicted dinucleotide-binding enzyme